GYWTDRWSKASAAPASVALLEEMPLDLGDWQGEKLEGPTRGTEHLQGQFYRRYKNHRTGAMVSVNLVCGRPGPVSIHTPDVCYGASGFDVADPMKFQRKDGIECWTAEAVQRKASEQTRLRLFWTWNAGGKWQAADNPRIAFARHPVLYKLYLVREL